MNDKFKQRILEVTGASCLGQVELIQTLWSGYGEIVRCVLNDADLPSIVAKHINLSKQSDHPRGWNTDVSHQRKLKSYEVEVNWYDKWSSQCSDICRVPDCLALEYSGNEILLVLEDLNSSGFPGRREEASMTVIKSCLLWLAEFHAIFMGQKPSGLWEQGTYWHLETRPDELELIQDKKLKQAAATIDQILEASPYQTFVHGDAKLANFCFSEDGSKASAVDFQYIGGGCGMKDVFYLISSCLDEDDCEHLEDELLDYYFTELKKALIQHQPLVDTVAVELDWRRLYRYAWADFYRFLEGWSPNHWKMHTYSKRLTAEVLDEIKCGRGGK